MKLTRAGICLILTAILCSLSLFLTACRRVEIPQPLVNVNVLHCQDFYLDTKTVDLATYTQGTIFVTRDEAHPTIPHLQIVAWMEIDSRDFGGIQFKIPIGWKLTNLVTDYPQSGEDPALHITTWYGPEGEDYYRILINIGGVWSIYDEVKGGKGMIVINIEPSGYLSELPDSLELNIGAGSSGENIIYPCQIVKKVSLDATAQTYANSTYTPENGRETILHR
jgi:hypothetical protein